MFVVFQSQIYFDWMVRLLAVSLLVQSFEMLRLKILWADGGIFSWALLRKSILFARPMMDVLFKENVFRALIVLNIVSASVLLVFGTSWVIIYPLFFICVLFIRLGGSFNGGSDAMTALVVAASAAHIVFPESEKITKFCLWYLALQIVLSYFVAGVAKLRSSSWRRGIALKSLFSKSNYVVPEQVLKILNWPLVSIAGCWGILIFECSFPLVLFNSQLAILYLGFAFVFHFLNFYVLGLNRFFWAWIAAYPALWCVVSLKL